MKRFLSILLFIVILVVAVTPAYAQESTGGARARIKAVLGQRAVVANATLSAKNGATLTVTKDGSSYSILTDSATKLRRRFWGNATLEEMQPGDTLNIVGTWKDEGKTTITAKLVRDISIQKRHGVFFGTVQSTSSTGFVIKTVNRGMQTVTTGSTTQFINRNGAVIKLSDVKVNDKVRVRGLWNRQLNTITDVTKVKDFSIPVRTATGSATQ